MWIRSQPEIHKEILSQNHIINTQYKIKSRKRKGGQGIKGEREQNKGKDRLAITTYTQEKSHSSTYKIIAMLLLQMLKSSEFLIFHLTIFSS